MSRTVRFCGKSVIIKGIIRAITADGKLLLKDILVDGEPWVNDHTWLKGTKALEAVRHGDRVVLRGLITEYIGLNEKAKQIIKLGFINVRLVRRTK